MSDSAHTLALPPPPHALYQPRKQAFTLIELSIVLVVIGLLVGGILVGRDLISAAAVRAQISQIEKYQQAVNTFRGKYGYLPGDIPEPDASKFGFRARGSALGQGDGNGLINGSNGGGSSLCTAAFSGETAMFWVDLSMANLIDGSFTVAYPNTLPSGVITGSQIGQYLPQAKIASNGYLYVWWGGWDCFWNQTGNPQLYEFNYLALVMLTDTSTYGGTQVPNDKPLLTVSQAYAIDKKVDDGLPQSGRIIALAAWGGWPSGATGVGGDFNSDDYSGGPITAQVTQPYYSTDGGATLAQTCYNNGHTLLPEHYSTEVSGTGINCWLSFRLQ